MLEDILRRIRLIRMRVAVVVAKERLVEVLAVGIRQTLKFCVAFNYCGVDRMKMSIPGCIF